MGDEWLVNENIDVDVSQLQDFAKAIQKELDTNFLPSFDNGLRPMLTVQAPFGGGGLKEGAFFRGRHDESRIAVGQLMGDVIKGLTSLSVAATSISAEYLMGDALAQATNDDVYNAFRAANGEQTLSERWQEEGGPADAIPAETSNPAVTDPYYGMDSCPTEDTREQAPAWAQGEVVGEGTSAYEIEDERHHMFGDEFRVDRSSQR
ncbi:hypothetical protein E0H26_26795 [Micromonospora zingiberis]|uniref:Uncharacterized protein n=1 Tax=Micromonospora zingiberis TaxID=2053011 RepID=A0A4R0G470_9ACTN|nr:hypothetical protein [Micromonospora zingiberis]TCB90692.1 hypothetical protein E0H26_26795 [Micromonospora zingiberis]